MDTMNKATIGWGRNLDDNGISQEEAEILFENDFQRTYKELRQFDWFNDQPDYIKDCLMNMNFNLGITKLLGFKKMIAALKEKDYKKAALEALDSRWATQVKTRATDIALIMREGYGPNS